MSTQQQDEPPPARVIVDGREVEVPAGTGLVEAAAEAGVEIPVFCYEPRIGPAVGACRMCMVEIEGMPKLQTACSTAVRDGMVVSTVSDKAREAQESVLEFLLINHPLDCPVCDKGGECPLQDQTYRWGPGSSRFRETKRVNDKPIPISPLIALDRERCILCYRCTRFASEVTGDLQLIPRQRGANTVIATFEGQPYADNFSGNIIELCPVGALTSTEYRFKARPWEAPDHPTVCGSCSVGCNVHATVREGEIQRVVSRENPAVDNGWLCDRGRFSYPSLRSTGRITAPQRIVGRDRPAGNSSSTPISIEGALEEIYQLIQADRDAKQPGPTWVLSGDQTLEEVYAIQRIAAATRGRVVAAEGGSAAGPPAGLTASIGDLVGAQHIVIIGDADLAHSAPVLELRVRDAVKAGARVLVAGIGGARLEALPAVQHSFMPPGGAAQFVADLLRDADLTQAFRESRTVVVATDGELSEDDLRTLADGLSLANPGSGILSLARASNARGLAALGVEPIGCEGLTGGHGLILVGVDPTRLWQESLWRPAIRSARYAVAVDVFPHLGHGAVNLVIPGTSALEKDGTIVNLEGRLQRLTLGAAAPDGVRSELAWLGDLGRRLGVQLPGSAAGTYRQLATEHATMPAPSHGEIPPGGVLGVQGGPVARPNESQAVSAQPGEVVLYTAPFLYDATDVANAERMEFLRSTSQVVLSKEDARGLGLRRGAQVELTIGGETMHATLRTSSNVQPGYARVTAGLAPLTRIAGTYAPCMVSARTAVSLGVDDQVGAQ